MTHALRGFCAWLQDTPFSRQIQTREWVIPAVQTLHLLAIAALMGATLLLDLRLLRVSMTDVPLARVARRFLPVVRASILVLLASGAVMIAAEPERSLMNTVFLWKMVLLAAALLLTAVTLRPLRRSPRFWDEGSRRRTLAGASAVLATGLWIGVLCAGRWIAYARG